ncbi:MAG TPA: histidine kinase [Thermoleophilaceae bacterium]|jgi:signal transduction histidine kinase|nr:histidine kinase [Thermoleophilaceae bacterium]
MRRGSLGLLVIGLAIGVACLIVVRGSPGESLAGGSPAGATALLGAGFALLGAGALEARRRPSSRTGVLLAGGGVAWLAVEFANPGSDLAVAFTVGLVCYALAPVLIAHGALTFPEGRLSSASERVVVAVAYVDALVLVGLVPALLSDPATEGCSECPRDLVAIATDAGLAAAVGRDGVWLGFACALALAVLAAWRLIRSSSAARLLKGPVLVPAAVFLSFVAARYAHGFDRGFLSNDATDHALWMTQAGALVLLALGVVAAWVRERRARTAVSRIVVELGQRPAGGGLRAALADALADPALELAYPLHGGRHVGADGRPVELHATDGRALTTLRRGREPIAVLLHRADLLDDPGLLDEVGAAASLALEHERLRAESQAQLIELRSSRARAVARADNERRRLERDLHDGAQQRLVVLSMALRLLRSELDDDAHGLVDAADVELRAALAELREIAHGIYPAVLAGEGLAPAVRALAESAPLPLRIESLTPERQSQPVETAAYFLIAEVARRGHLDRATVSAVREEGRLRVEIVADGELDANLVDLEDRIGALDGSLVVDRAAGGTVTIRAEMPCG